MLSRWYWEHGEWHVLGNVSEGTARWEMLIAPVHAGPRWLRPFLQRAITVGEAWWTRLLPTLTQPTPQTPEIIYAQTTRLSQEYPTSPA